MQHINGDAKKIILKLIAGLENLGDAKKIDTTNGSFMPVSIERIDENDTGVFYSVCHYGEQNGDLMRDPEMIFYEMGGEFYPTYFRNDYVGIERESLIFDENGDSKINLKEQNDQKNFANQWMINISEQQSL